MTVYINLGEKVKIDKIDANTFNVIDEYLNEIKEAEDRIPAKEIRQRILGSGSLRLNPEEFANELIYVVLTSGFRQKTAKKAYENITEIISGHGANYDMLIETFKNKNKITSICKIWDERKHLNETYYSIEDDKDKIEYLSSLPHIGPTTKHHIARNLGVDVVKYDVWIQRLAIFLYGNPDKDLELVNFPVNDKVKKYADEMFKSLVKETGHPQGYIDLILWKACQIGVIDFD